jgi:hypothetical protein
MYATDPAIRARNANFCAQDEARLAAGTFFDASVQGFKTLFNLATAAPGDPSPIPVFPPGTTNLQALLFALSVPDPSNPLNFTDTFIRLVGDPATSTLTFADLDRVLLLGPLVGNYAPVHFIRDGHCAIGGVDTHFTSNLSAFDGDVLVYAEGHGFRTTMIDTGCSAIRRVIPDAGVRANERNQTGGTKSLHPAAFPFERKRGRARMCLVFWRAS